MLTTVCNYVLIIKYDDDDDDGDDDDGGSGSGSGGDGVYAHVCMCGMYVIEEPDSSKDVERSSDKAKLSDSTSKSLSVRSVNYVLINHRLAKLTL